MNDAQMREFRALSRAVRLPDGVRERVLEGRAAADDAGRAGTPRPRLSGDIERARAHRRRACGRERPWRLVVRTAAVMALALTLLVGTAMAGVPLPWLQGTDGGEAAAPASEDSRFVLRAYAAERAQGGSEDPSLAPGRFFSSYGLSGGDGNAIAVSAGFDLTVEGEGIDTVTYTLESDELQVGTTSDGSDRSSRMYFEWGQAGEGSDGVGPSLTVGYDEQLRPVGDRGAYRMIWYHGQAPDELAEVRAQMRGDGPESEQAWERWHELVIDSYNEALAKTRIRVTVAFDDGTTQDQVYVIRAQDDYWQASRDREAALDELQAEWDAQGEPSGEEAAAAVDQVFAEHPLYAVDRVG